MKSLCHRMILLLFALMQISHLSAQSYRDYMRSGNRLFRDSVYDKSEVDYRKVVELMPRFAQGYFNLGNALFRNVIPKTSLAVSSRLGTRIKLTESSIGWTQRSSMTM